MYLIYSPSTISSFSFHISWNISSSSARIPLSTKAQPHRSPHPPASAGSAAALLHRSHPTPPKTESAPAFVHSAPALALSAPNPLLHTLQPSRSLAVTVAVCQMGIAYSLSRAVITCIAAAESSWMGLRSVAVRVESFS
ncbi:hypothetical protein K432DRAFT_186304 [Lepidopterella palustris CBS 459.81]|uniref:Uncharacterized protein n=1 Tax=Lepidopterella palustris CBS 459.81 TaxID=1314670 RepID=A0A8E2ELJ1_9PEZI|nr:hypothetical protein K432DRAFT_186304 [Lepidopterella palustris CBS 459.81]